MWWDITLLYIIFSKILENDVNSELDTLFLSPFICSGVIIEYFNLDGKTLEFRDMLMMRHSDELIKSALICTILIEISSYPHEFFQGKEWMIFSISPIGVLWKTMLVKGR